MANDGETWYAFHALYEFGWRPSEFANLPRREKALVIAMIDKKLEQKKKELKKIKKR